MVLEVPAELETSIDKHKFIINTLYFLEHNIKIIDDE